MAFLGNIQAWIYTGAPACDAGTEMVGRNIFTLKPEYYTVNASGNLVQLTVAVDGCNAFSAANVAAVKANSSQQYVTVSGKYANFSVLLGDSVKEAACTSTLVNFVNAQGLSGVELDWEGFGAWTATKYAQYKTYVNTLGLELQKYGKKLMIDCPHIANATEQGWWLFKYEDFDSLSGVDYLCIMSYDNQWNYGGGGSSVQPLTWATNGYNWAAARVSDVTRLVIGIPSYGYHATPSAYDVVIDTYDQTALVSGFNTGTNATNADAERNFTSGGKYYAYMDTNALNTKRNNLETAGSRMMSVWHLGGNEWFSNTEPAIVANATNTSSTTLPDVAIGNYAYFMTTITLANTAPANNYLVNAYVQFNYPATGYDNSSWQYTYNGTDWFSWTPGTDIYIPMIERANNHSISFRALALTSGTYSSSITIKNGNLASPLTQSLTSVVAGAGGGGGAATGDFLYHAPEGKYIVDKTGNFIRYP